MKKIVKDKKGVFWQIDKWNHYVICDNIPEDAVVLEADFEDGFTATVEEYEKAFSQQFNMKENTSPWTDEIIERLKKYVEGSKDFIVEYRGQIVCAIEPYSGKGYFYLQFDGDFKIEDAKPADFKVYVKMPVPWEKQEYETSFLFL